MNCPHCHQDLPENYGAVYCTFCGKDLPAPIFPNQESPSVKFKWRLFLCAMLFPALLTLLSSAAMRFLIFSQPVNEGVSPWVGLIGGIIGGVICGLLLAFQSRNLWNRIILSIFMSAIMIVICIVLCFFGCNIGGYQLALPLQ